jgi:hypothetical protein
MRNRILIVLALAASLCGAFAGVGDPQIRTDHPWYPGELAFSNFERLFEIQAAIYERELGQRPETDEQKALASWFWRNTHYWHGETGKQDVWGLGLNQGRDLRPREYWTGFFAYGFGLCGTTHSQWTAEMEHLLGHGRGRGVGVHAHNAFEVFLTGGEYGDGKWALLDHDLSTVIFDPAGKRLLSIREVKDDLSRMTDRQFRPERQRGWLVCGLHPNDGAGYRKYAVAEYLAGYAGPPPMVNLRQGESLRRYIEPGLEDGKTFVFWGRNYNTDEIPGPERSRTWVNQPEAMHGSKMGTAHQNGQARYANAEYIYRPSFRGSAYKDGVVDESDAHVTFEFRTPYLIGATPPDNGAWAIYESGCRNGLKVSGAGNCSVAVSVDKGTTWTGGGMLKDGLDLTDHVKGRQQYWLRFDSSAKSLRNAAIEIRTVCQANVAALPRLTDDGSRVEFQASGNAVVSAGPGAAEAKPHIIAGAFNSPRVTLQLETPRSEPAIAVYAAAHVASSNPPDPKVRYQIECSTDGGATWKAVTKDWSIPRRGDEPGDFWSQSFCYGAIQFPEPVLSPVQVRFRNDGGKRYLRAEAHLVYDAGVANDLNLTFAWTDNGGPKTFSKRFSHGTGENVSWEVPTGKKTKTHWIEFGVGTTDSEK